MSFEFSYVNDLAKTLSKTGPDLVESKLDEQLEELKKRSLELDSARRKMEAGLEQFFEGLFLAYPSLDRNDPNLIGSSNRMARAYIEICAGLGVDEKEVFTTTFPAENYNEMVMLKEIEYTSLCAHHFFPFVGKAHVGYLPDTNELTRSKVVGLSKLARVVDCFAKRPQLQERLCMEIMTAIKEELRPAGVMVVLEGLHSCLSCRGAKKTSASMLTSAVDGKFKESNKLRAEFLDLLKLRK